MISLWDFSFSVFTLWLTVGSWNHGKLDHGYWGATVHTFMNCKVLGSVSYYFHHGSRGMVVGEAPCRVWQHGNFPLPPCTKQTSQPPPEPASLCAFALSTASVTNMVINVHISKIPAKKIIFMITCLGLHHRGSGFVLFCFIKIFHFFPQKKWLSCNVWKIMVNYGFFKKKKNVFKNLRSGTTAF